MSGYRSAIFMVVCFLFINMSVGNGCSMNSVGPTETVPITGGSFTIDNVGVSAITDTSALISWSTSKNAVSTVTVSSVPTFTPYQRYSTPISFTHALDLGSLAPSTTYYYKINAAEIEHGDTTSVRTKNFVTDIDSELQDQTPPVITDVEVINITSQSATITWKTDDRCDGEVHYGLGAPDDSTMVEIFEPPFTHLRTHSVQLLNLAHTTTYSFAIEATNVAGRLSRSPVNSFTTTDMPSISFCPPTMILASEQSFNLGVCVSGVQDMGAISIVVKVDPSLIELTGQPQPDGFSVPGPDNYGVHLWMSSYDRNAGIAIFEATWLIQMDGDLMLGTNADGNDVVCYIPCLLLPKADLEVNPIDVEFRTDEQTGDFEPYTFIKDYLRHEVDTSENGTCRITIGTE